MHRLRFSTAAVRRHPFIIRLDRYLELGEDDLEALWALVEAEITVGKRRDLVVDQPLNLTRVPLAPRARRL